MSVDTPARIAILGAGPIGLEAALYARFLGYDVDLYERGRVCEHLHQWAHVRLFTPAGMNRTSLGVAALRAQEPDLVLPPEDALQTTGELLDSYLLPLAHSDLLVDNLHLQTEVLSIGREGLLKGERIGDDERADFPFRILIRQPDGQEAIHTADVVIDATGTYGNHNWLGDGGIPALGELNAQSHIDYGLPNIFGGAEEEYAGKHTLVVGAGYSAATNVLALAALAAQADGTRVTWVTRRAQQPPEAPPIDCIAEDPLAERERVALAANHVARHSEAVAYRPGTTVAAVQTADVGEGFVVQLQGAHAGELHVDRVIANVGYRPDSRIYQELQVHECYATSGPMQLAKALLAHRAADCLDQPSAGAAALLTPEPNFYILGSKSYGRTNRFLLAAGHKQIRHLFTLIGDREGLNLYQSVG